MTGPQFVMPEPTGHWQVAVTPIPRQLAPGLQTLPHWPQFMLLIGVQALLQTICPAWQVAVAQVPFVQTLFGGHCMPQPPQLAGSDCTFVHVPGLAFMGHLISPAGQFPQVPLVQAAPTTHAMPQPPQLAASVWVFTHAPLQEVNPAGHAQLPEMHEAPVGHACPHEPQLLASLVGLTHPAAPQLISPVPHTHAVTPPVVSHVAPVPQTTPHTPQLKLSVCVFTHAPLHVFGRLVGQPQLLAVQTPWRRQACPQDPQSVGLLVMSWQPSAQVMVPAGHVQTPALHMAPGLHFMPHPLQFAGSVIVLVHTELHRVGIPAGQLQCPLVHVAP
jgi:hypothetical protein